MIGLHNSGLTKARADTIYAAIGSVPVIAETYGVVLQKASSTTVTLTQFDATGYEITMEASGNVPLRAVGSSTLTLDVTTVGANGMAADGSGGTITNVVNNGSGLYRVTSANHGLSTSDQCKIQNVGGTTGVNAAVTVTRIDANTFDVQSLSFAGTYTSGGTWYKTNTWHNIWAISTGSTLALLASISSTAPTLPSSYTYKGRISAFHIPTNGTGVIDQFIQFGNRAAIPQTVVFSALAGSTTWASRDISTVVPPTARAVSGNFGTQNTQTYGIAVGASANGEGMQLNILQPASFGSSTFLGYDQGSAFTDVPLLTPQTIWYICFDTRTNYRMDITGYVLG